MKTYLKKTQKTSGKAGAQINAKGDDIKADDEKSDASLTLNSPCFYRCPVFSMGYMMNHTGSRPQSVNCLFSMFLEDQKWIAMSLTPTACTGFTVMQK